MNWWLISIIVLIGILLIKFKEYRHRLSLIVVIILLLFFVATFGQLYSSNNLDLSTFEGIVSAFRVYGLWLWNAGGNMMKISGYAVKQDWGVNITDVGNNLTNLANSSLNSLK
jgi:hypothetical protein